MTEMDVVPAPGAPRTQTGAPTTSSSSSSHPQAKGGLPGGSNVCVQNGRWELTEEGAGGAENVPETRHWAQGERVAVGGVAGSDWEGAWRDLRS